MKLIATIVATFALLFGGAAVVAPAIAHANEPSCIDSDGDGEMDAPWVDADGDGVLDVEFVDADGDGEADDPCVIGGDVPDPEAGFAATPDTGAAESSALVRKVDRLQRIADKRAAKIKKLRAKIRALR